MSDWVLNVENLGKCYAEYNSQWGRFARWFGWPSKPAHEYWAIRNASFQLRKGESVALVGKNGAGKSTLLKLITGTIRPTEGSVTVHGRVSAILELGIGFNPDFTGRQNIYLAGGMMGLWKAPTTWF
jgi:lipopolysaccharide transport system ATP-binding protein